jgi:hypothetical protein
VHKDEADALVVREGVPAHTSVEETRRVRVFSDRAKIKNPEILAVSMFKKPLCVVSIVPIETFKPFSWVSHYYDPVGEVDEI